MRCNGYPTHPTRWSVLNQITRRLTPRQERRRDIPQREAINALPDTEKDQLIATLRAALEESERARGTDALTGLPNRDAWLASVKSAAATVVAVLDVDGLKWINDNLGHPAGDALLCLLANLLREARVLAYRTGGDEFILRFPSVWQARLTMKSIARCIRAATFQFIGTASTPRVVTGADVSYGIGHSVEQAEARWRKHREVRERRGLRAARGQCPPSLTEFKGSERVSLASSATDEGDERHYYTIRGVYPTRPRHIRRVPKLRVRPVQGPTRLEERVA